ncbi:MAG: RHS repeat-associated core domain-containing protein, partial [Betaproteobacteria bacterium]|nr:RHS repeat-associated core domain-containing protein [Betaproteobacteria bacterium]
FGANPANENPAGLGAFAFNLRFPGQLFDAETGTHYNYFRDYDPAIGRYIESDPIGLEGGINTYGYVTGNPLSSFDATGQFSVPPQLWPALGLFAVGYGAGSALIDAIGNGVDAFLCYRDQRLAQEARDAAFRACDSYPQGGACNSLDFFERQVYRTTAASTAAGGYLSASDMSRKTRRGE